MKRIASRDNPSFRTLRQWATDGAARRDAGIALLEGIHLADACLGSGIVPRQIVVGGSSHDHPEVRDLLARVADASPRPESFVLEDALFAVLSQLAHGTQLIFVVARPAPVAPERIERTTVLLDRVQDPGNVGSILRTAAAAGIADVYLSRQCAAAWSPKVLRAAMGAHFHLRLFEDCDLAQLACAPTVTRLATSPHAAASIHDTDLRRNIAWLFGHEGQGVDAALLRDADVARIPQPGAVESLNVAASAAICLFEQVRQRSAG